MSGKTYEEIRLWRFEASAATPISWLATKQWRDFMMYYSNETEVMANSVFALDVDADGVIEVVSGGQFRESCNRHDRGVLRLRANGRRAWRCRPAVGDYRGDSRIHHRPDRGGAVCPAEEEAGRQGRISALVTYLDAQVEAKPDLRERASSQPNLRLLVVVIATDSASDSRN